MKAWINRFLKGMNDNVAFKISFAFFTVFVVFIMMLLMVYYSSSRVIIEKQKTVNGNLMNLYVQRIDNIWEKTDAVLYGLSSELAEYKDYENLSIENRLKLLNMQYLTFGTELDFASVYIYLKNSNTIVSVNSQISSIDIFSDRSWIEPYNNAGFLGYSTFYIYNRTNDRNNTEVLTAIREFPLESQVKSGALILNLERRSLFSDFYENIQDDELIFVCDDKGKLIFGDDESFNEYEVLLDEELSEGVVKRVGGRRMFLTEVSSSYNNWRYIKVQSYSSLLSELVGLKIVLAFMIAMALAAVVVAVYALNRKVAKPIVSLIEKINENEILQTELYKKYNELEYLDSAIELLLESKKLYNSEEKNHRENSMRSILVSICANEKISEEELLKIHFNAGSFFVATVVRISSYDEIADKAGLKNMLLKRLKEAETDELNILAGYISEDTMLALVCMKNSEKRAAFKEKLKFLKTEVENETQAVLSIGIGNAYTGTEKINETYREAMNVLHFAVFANQNDVVDAASYAVQKGNIDYKETIRIEIEYVKYLKKADYEKTVECLVKIINQMPQNVEVAENLSGLLWRFADDIFAVMNEMGISPMSAIEYDYDECYERFLRTQSLDELKKMLFGMVQRLTNYIKERRESTNEDVMDSIRKYIEEHFEKNVTLDEISEMVHLSPNYVSTLFRKQYNKSFSAYVNELKMEKAVWWLTYTDKNVDEISGKLGYANFRSFIRAFKNRYNVTPSQYRKEAALEKMNRETPM